MKDKIIVLGDSIFAKRLENIIQNSSYALETTNNVDDVNRIMDKNSYLIIGDATNPSYKNNILAYSNTIRDKNQNSPIMWLDNRWDIELLDKVKYLNKVSYLKTDDENLNQ